MGRAADHRLAEAPRFQVNRRQNLADRRHGEQVARRQRVGLGLLVHLAQVMDAGVRAVENRRVLGAARTDEHETRRWQTLPN